MLVSERVRHLVAALLAVAAAALFAVGGVGRASAEATPMPITDATFSWSLNDQTNARSHNPAAINFLAAGVADPGRGGVELPESRWAGAAGNVTIQKRDAAGLWQTATWAGLGTDAGGVPIGIYGPFSGHRVSIGAGTGTIDPDTDSASITWSGTFTVVYYGGNTVFTVTDPVLEVAGGTGTVTALLGGWDADRTDPRIWTPVTPQRVTVADLAGVDVTAAGVLATPTYTGVAVSGTVVQDRTGPTWGSFPAAMIAFLGPLGIDQFWYSTGLQSDGTKVPSPIMVGYGGQAPVEPTPTASATPTPTATPTNEVVKPPKPSKPPKPTETASPTKSGTPTPSPTAATATSAPSAASIATPDTVPQGVLASPTQQAGPQAAAGPVVQSVVVLAATTKVAAGLTSTSAPVDTDARWWVGGLLLLGAALLLLVPAPRR